MTIREYLQVVEQDSLPKDVEIKSFDNILIYEGCLYKTLKDDASVNLLNKVITHVRVRRKNRGICPAICFTIYTESENN